jgi:LmbE family N-acetylglucosaminyl deacetylase
MLRVGGRAARSTDTRDVQQGYASPGELDRPVVVSPHLDDAALSCAYFLIAHPGTPVITLFTASPSEGADAPNAFEMREKHRTRNDVMTIRRTEDSASLGILGAVPEWLGFCQHSDQARAKNGYAIPRGAIDTLERALRVHDPTAVLFPLGLGHPDHAVVHQIALSVRNSFSTPAWFCYQDKPYEHIPGTVSSAIVRLHRYGLTATPSALPVTTDLARKWRAISEYRSQVADLERAWQIEARIAASPEAYWRIDTGVSVLEARFRGLRRAARRWLSESYWNARVALSTGRRDVSQPRPTPRGREPTAEVGDAADHSPPATYTAT